jgi:hypothetical protein
MTQMILDHIRFQLDLDNLMRMLHVKADSARADDFKRLADEAQAIARPKALYRLAFVEFKGDDHVIVEGIKLTSRVLRVNLEKVHRVFLFVTTCGLELEDWSSTVDGTLRGFWADMIKLVALQSATHALNEHLTERYRLGRTSTMNPGSLADWPVQEQRPLFTLLGNPEEAVGVRLLDSYLMFPTKSVSGILFPTEESFESCQLCPREDCPGRRAPYDKDLYDRKYRLDAPESVAG